MALYNHYEFGHSGAPKSKALSSTKYTSNTVNIRYKDIFYSYWYTYLSTYGYILLRFIAPVTKLEELHSSCSRPSFCPGNFPPILLKRSNTWWTACWNSIHFHLAGKRTCLYLPQSNSEYSNRDLAISLIFLSTYSNFSLMFWLTSK